MELQNSLKSHIINHFRFDGINGDGVEEEVVETNTKLEREKNWQKTKFPSKMKRQTRRNEERKMKIKLITWFSSSLQFIFTLILPTKAYCPFCFCFF